MPTSSATNHLRLPVAGICTSVWQPWQRWCWWPWARPWARPWACWSWSCWAVVAAVVVCCATLHSTTRLYTCRHHRSCVHRIPVRRGAVLCDADTALSTVAISTFALVCLHSCIQLHHNRENRLLVALTFPPIFLSLSLALPLALSLSLSRSSSSPWTEETVGGSCTAGQGFDALPGADEHAHVRKQRRWWPCWRGQCCATISWWLVAMCGISCQKQPSCFC